jgi:hypothetical protein
MADGLQFPNTPISPQGTIASGANKADDVHQVIRQLLYEAVGLRDKMVDRRVAIQNERRHCSKQLQLALEKQTKFVDICAVNTPEDGLAQAFQSNIAPILSSLKEVQSSTGRLIVFLNALNEEEAKLCTLESDLEQRESQLYSQLVRAQNDGLAPALPNGDGVALEDYAARSIQNQPSTPSIETIPVVREYYDRIGDLGLMEESLYNFESEHQRQTRLREEWRQEGRTVRPPDAAFFQEYFNKRRSRIQEYSAMKEDVERLKSKCVHQGHEVDDPQIHLMVEVNTLDHSYRIAGLEELDLTKIEEISTTRSVALPTTRPTFLPGIEARHRISQWLERVQVEHAEAMRICLLPDVDGILAEAENSALQHLIGDDISVTHSDSASSSRGWSRFHGEPPKRRYSDPMGSLRNSASLKAL